MYPDFDTPLPVKIIAALAAIAVVVLMILYVAHSAVGPEEVHALRSAAGK